VLPIALDGNRELATELGLLLSAYAIIDLYVLRIFSITSGLSEDQADLVFARVRGNHARLELLRELIAVSDRAEKEKELRLLGDVARATDIRNEYAHAIYSAVAASPTGWRMSLWQSDGRSRKKRVKDVSVESVRIDGAFMRDVLEALYHFGGARVQYE
jgi:hypothetical protein